MPIVSIIVSWQRIMRIMESVLIEVTGTIILIKTSSATYQQQNIHQPVGEFEMPMGFEQMKAFETLNDVATNVFGYDKGQLYPLRVSIFESDFVMDLLLLYDADIYHYVLITDLVKVVCKVRDLKFRFGYRICRNCFWLCRDGLESYNIHTENCYLNALQLFKCHHQIKMNTSSQIFQPRGLFLWSFILTLNFFSYPSLDVMQQLTNRQHAWLKGTSHVDLLWQLLIITQMFPIFIMWTAQKIVWAFLFECCIC